MRIALGPWAVACLWLLMGCGGKTTSTPAKPGENAQPAAEDTLARIKREGVLKWGSDGEGGAPYVYNDPNNPDRYIGFEIEIMEKLAQHLGVKAERFQGAWDELPEHLLSRRDIDLICNGIEITEERKQRLRFTDPYFRYAQLLTVRKEDQDKYKTLADLKGKKVSTLVASQSVRELEAAGFSEEQIITCPDSDTPYRELDTGRVDACLQDNIIALFYAAPEKMPRLHIIPEEFGEGYYGMAARPEDASLVAELNRILALMKKNGDLAAIYKKWNLYTPGQKKLGILEGL
jgi:polar amino acid transport system substrate-binding protein